MSPEFPAPSSAGPGRTLVVGESLVDVVVTPDGGRTEHVGGSPMNVAVGLARLDVPTVLLTRLGDDERGRRVADHVHASGVELAAASVHEGTTTSTATAHLDDTHAATYAFDITWDLAPHGLAEAAALHVGSIAAILPPGSEAVLDLVRQAAAGELFVSFDPNVRPAFVTDPGTGWRRLTRTAEDSTLVKLSDEDLATLWPGAGVRKPVRELLAGRRTELVILTRGGQGCTVFRPGLELAVPAPEVTVVDTVGAGDSFMAATLAVLHRWGVTGGGPGALARLDEARLTTLARAAMAAAALTCSRSGADPPTRSELPSTWPDR